MKKLLPILFLAFIAFSSWGQDKDSKRQKYEKIKAYKIAFITDRINLSSSQAETFWPVYDEFDKKRRDNFKQQKLIYRRASNKDQSEKENLADQEKILALKQEDVDLNRTYRTKLLKIISAKQYTQLMDAEHDFHKLLMEQLKARKKN